MSSVQDRWELAEDFPYEITPSEESNQSSVSSAARLRIVDEDGSVRILRHMPGKHDQSSHGHGNAGPGGGTDLIAAGHADAIAAGAFEAAAAMPRTEDDAALAGSRMYHGGGIGPHGDEALHHIAAAQGFEGQARGVSRKEMDKAVKGGGTEMFRGVRPRDGKTAEQMHEQMRSGEAYHGLGFAGNGTYMSNSRGEASTYGTVGRYALHREAKVIDFRQLQDEQADYLQSIGYRDKGKFSTKTDSITGRVFDDPGRYAAARGYDAIRWRRGEEVGKAPGVEDEFIILNRTALLAEVGS